MEITETLKEDLHREFKIVVGAKDLDEKLTGRLAEMQPRIHLKGFRPGKAPVSFLKKTYGKSLMGEIVNNVVSETSEQALKERSLKAAAAPKVDFVNELETVVTGKADLEFTVKVDLMPEFLVKDFSGLEVERLVADVADADIDDALKRLADSRKTYADKSGDAAAETGDAVVIDYEGKIDGEPFDGGKGEDVNVVLGSGTFIPGFEDQLSGAKPGEQRVVKIAFPADYTPPRLAGKEAEFDVQVKAVRVPEDVEIDDAFAQSLGLETLAMLREAINHQIARDYMHISRGHLKRRILDALDSDYNFPLPSGMVESEFDAIWRHLQSEIEREGMTEEEKEKSEDELKAEYRAIAERRVRLGLVLAKIGEQNGLQVDQEELSRAIAARARQFPGREEQVTQYILNNPPALAEIRVPLFEDKVVDFISELIRVVDKKVPREILMLDPDTAAERLDAEAKAAEGAKKPKAKSRAKRKSKKKSD